MKRVSKVVGALAALGFVMGIGVSAPAHFGGHHVNANVVAARALDTGWD